MVPSFFKVVAYYITFIALPSRASTPFQDKERPRGRNGAVRKNSLNSQPHDPRTAGRKKAALTTVAF